MSERANERHGPEGSVHPAAYGVLDEVVVRP